MRVPEGWEVKYLSELANRISDGIHTTPVYVNDSDVYFINGNNLAFCIAIILHQWNIAWAHIRAAAAFNTVK